jgi:hypothetical protein
MVGAGSVRLRAFDRLAGPRNPAWRLWPGRHAFGFDRRATKRSFWDDLAGNRPLVEDLDVAGRRARPLLDRAAIEYVLWDVAEREVDPSRPRLVLRMGHDPHLELEPENIDAVHGQFPSGLDSLMHLALRHRRIDWANHHKRPRFASMERGCLERAFRFVGAKDEREVMLLLLKRDCPPLFFRGSVGSIPTKNCRSYLPSFIISKLR